MGDNPHMGPSEANAILEPAPAVVAPPLEYAPAVSPSTAGVTGLQRSAGNQAVGRAMSRPSATPLAPFSLARSPTRPLARCACGGVAPVGGECAKCKAARLGQAEPDAQVGVALAGVAARRREPATVARADGGAPDAGTATAGAGAATATAGADASTAGAGAAADGGTGGCALVDYTNANFTNRKVRADTEFTDSLDAIAKHAEDAKVKVFITDSFRASAADVDLSKAVVDPAQNSNHFAGHAIDMNLQYGNGEFCNSTCLKGAEDKWPEPVKTFIDAIRSDSGLDWGGDFKNKDVVHIDDGLNENMDAWKARVAAVRACK